MKVVITNPSADNAPIINSALISTTDGIVELPPGVIQINSPIIGQSNRRLVGSTQGGTTLLLKSTFVYTAANNGAIFADSLTDFSVTDLTIDNAKIGWTQAGGFGTRLCGIRHTNCSDFVVERVTVKNASGYSFWPSGTANTPSQTNLMTQRAAYRDCWSYNANVHFEALRCNDILFENCNSRSGDGDIPCEAGFHPLTFGSRISFCSCSHDSNGSGFLLVASGSPLLGIVVDSCNFVSKNFRAITADSQGQQVSVLMTNSRFESLVGHGTDIGGGGGGATWRADNCQFIGTGSTNTAGLVVGGEVDFSAVNCLAFGTCSGGAGTQANGAINSNVTKRITFDGELRAVATGGGSAIAKGAVRIVLSPNTVLSPNPQRNEAVFLEATGQAVATNLVAGTSSQVAITLPAECLTKAKAHLTLSLLDSVVPAGNLSYSWDVTQGTPFVTAKILGNFTGKTFSYYYRELL
jgi:Pectate lyase superfamily protein